MQDKISTILISDKSQTLEILKLYIKEFEDLQLVTDFYTRNDIVDFIKNYDNPIIVLDVSNDTNTDLVFISEILKVNSSCKLIALFDELNIEIMIKFIRCGVHEFITSPILKSEFKNAIMNVQQLIKQEINQKPHEKSKIISVFSNKGGIGKTAIATNLALAIAQTTKEKVALLDLNFQFGDITTFLDLKPTFDISYLLQNSDKINETFLMRMLDKYKDTSLYVLPASPYLQKMENIKTQELFKLFEILKKVFSYIVIDTATSFDEKNLTALSQTDLLLFITVANLPVLRNTQKCLELFDKLGFDKDKIKIILNRFMENDEIGIKDVEKLMDEDIYWKIPNNYFTMMSSINKGVPVVISNSGSNIAKSYNDFVQKITDDLLKDNLTKKYTNILS